MAGCADGALAVSGGGPVLDDVLLAGAAVLRSLCAVSGVAGLTISDGGIRHGVLIGD